MTKVVVLLVRVVRNMNNEMKPRKLNKEEHFRTRELWEAVFPEDTPDFLDYYYSVKTTDNEIYVIEDEKQIVSMLHLNPYQMRIGDEIYKTHYIVAVATDEKYRGRGFMTTLLNHALQIMGDREEPFTFLMPAAEAIYRPFGFEFVYRQGRSRVKGMDARDTGLCVMSAKEEDCEEIAEFANSFLSKYDVVTWRTEDYYRMILAEQRSENGGILVAKRNGKMVGVLCYAKENQYEIREPLFYKEEELRQAVYYLTGNETESILCVGYGEEEEKPMIMAKCLQQENKSVFDERKVFLNEVV